MTYSANVNGKLIQMFVGGTCDDADEIDWALMIAARSLAATNKMFDPSMYAANVGKMVHARACEMSADDFMVMDMSENKVVDAPWHPYEGERAVLIPNHTHIVICRSFDGYVVTMCKGREVNTVLNDKGTFQVGAPDPQHAG